MTDDARSDTNAAKTGDPVTRAVQDLEGLIATRPGGEVRPQQKEMVENVAEAFQKKKHLIVQAGTGVGKSYGYLVPAISSGQKVVISTATKQLSEQIAGRDLPYLASHLTGPDGKPFTYALLKGRGNYICRLKTNDLQALDAEAAQNGAGGNDVEAALFEATEYDARRPSSADLERLNALLTWADESKTGDRTDAPACSDRVWGQVSTDSSGCVGASTCQFGDDCFAEVARDKAKVADLVVTNHAMVAADLVSPGPMFADHDAIVFDEAHHVQEYLSRAWGLEIRPLSIKHTLAEARRTVPRGDAGEKTRDLITSAVEDCNFLADNLAEQEPGVWKEVPDTTKLLITALRDRLGLLVGMMRRHAESESVTTHAQRIKSAGQNIEAWAGQLVEYGIDSIEVVRWLEKGTGNIPETLRTAPLWVGDKLIEALEDRTMICTSATLTVGGSFDQTARVFGLIDIPDRYKALDVGTPFDYKTQACLYIPDAKFPAPVGKDRFEHIAAVKEELEALVKAAGGRTLALFTTRRAAEDAGAYLRERVSTPVLIQGDVPPAQLLEEFEQIEASTLCATMGFWHGVDVVGPSLSCVVIDKVPFAPFKEPLLAARLEAADAEGRSGFNEIYVADATTMVAQGFGRLIRSGTDKGVVAILDPRMRTKGYGKVILRSLPSLTVFSDRNKITGALQRLAAARDGEIAGAA